MSFRKAVDAIVAAVEALPVMEGEPSIETLTLMEEVEPLIVAEAAGNITKRRILRTIRDVADPALAGSSDSATALIRELRLQTIDDNGLGDPAYMLDRLGDPDTWSDELLACAQKDILWKAAEQLEHLLALYEQRYADVKLISARENGKGQFVTELQSGLCALFAEHFAQILKADGAENFVQVEAVHPELGPLTFTIEKRLGRAPAVKLADAEQRIAFLEAELAKAAIGGK